MRISDWSSVVCYSDLVEPVRPNVPAKPGSETGDPTELSDAAAHRRVGLQDRRGVFLQQLEMPPAAHFDLTGRHVDRCRSRQPRMIGDVIGTERLFDPEGIVGFEDSHV